jgi:alanine racemase
MRSRISMRALFTDRRNKRPISDGDNPPAPGRPTKAVIDLGALEQNFKKAAALSRGRKLLAVVKAQAYGHGAVEVSRRLLSWGADMLGVALVEEGRELREAGIDAPILVMGPIVPEQAGAVAALGLSTVVFTDSVARALSEAAGKHAAIKVHVKIDTGMGRIGISPEEAPGFIARLGELGGLDVEGLMTHFADADLRDKRFASSQVGRFEALLRELERRRINVPLRHTANSAALLDFERALFTMVRPGLMLYGYNPLEGGPDKAGLRPVLSLVSRIAFLKKVPPGHSISYGRTFVTKRESLIATLPIGYADGYSRGLSNRGVVLVRGARAPIAGRVCMDMCMLDVTDVPGVGEGDEAVLIGSQENDRITADDVAAMTGTISYEVLCAISSRVPRIYHYPA